MRTEKKSSAPQPIVTREAFLKNLPQGVPAQVARETLLQLLKENPKALQDPEVQEQLKNLCVRLSVAAGQIDLDGKTADVLDKLSSKKEPLNENDLQTILLACSNNGKVDARKLFVFVDAFDKNGKERSFYENGTAGQMYSNLRSGCRAYASAKDSKPSSPAYPKPPASVQSTPSKEDTPVRDAIDAARNLVSAIATLFEGGVKGAASSAKVAQIYEKLATLKKMGPIAGPLATALSGALEALIAASKGDYAKAAGAIMKAAVSLTPFGAAPAVLNAAITLLKECIPADSSLGKKMHAALDFVQKNFDIIDRIGTGTELVVKFFGLFFEGNKQEFDKKIQESGVFKDEAVYGPLLKKLGDHFGDELWKLHEDHKNSLKSENPTWFQHRLGDLLHRIFRGK